MLTACGSSTPELPALSATAPSGQYEITMVYSEAEELHWEVVLSGKSLTATHRKRTLRPQCSDSWNESCWRSSESTAPLSESELRQLLGWAVELAQSHPAIADPPAPGSSHLQLLVRQAGHATRHLIVPMEGLSEQPNASLLLAWLKSSEVDGPPAANGREI